MYNTVFPKMRHMVIYAFSQNLPKLQHSAQAKRWNFSLQNILKTWSLTVSIPDGKAVFIKKQPYKVIKTSAVSRVKPVEAYDTSLF